MNRMEVAFAPRPTQAEIARAIGVHKSTITRLLQGERPPTTEQAEALARYFQVTVEELMDFLKSRTSSKVAA